MGPAAAMLLALAGCGGAAAPSTVGESTTSADTAGGDYAGEEEAGAAEGGEMMVGPLGPEQQDTVDGYDDEVTQLTSDLDGAMELASPDCGRAGELRDAICDLADRICSIADDNPEHEDVAGQCEDGQSRCESARDRVDQRCP